MAADTRISAGFRDLGNGYARALRDLAERGSDEVALPRALLSTGR
jgi:hypothetical protein